MDIAMSQISEIQIVRRSPISREMFTRFLRAAGPLLVSSELGSYGSKWVASCHSWGAQNALALPHFAV